jgi:two-component system, cell cycle response regulator DivK
MMSPRTLSDDLHHLQAEARLLVGRTGEHQNRLGRLVASAERDQRRAEAVSLEATLEGVEKVRHLLRSHVRRSIAGATIARQLRASAREQHDAACRLLADLDPSDTAAASRANAVLVVDDYEDVRDLIAFVLQDAGFVVKTAANGLEALIAAYHMRPGVIVMDVAMPVLDGIEATRLIKASDITRDARVIAYTGNPTMESALVPRLFSAVLQKPATPDVVLATVQHVASL